MTKVLMIVIRGLMMCGLTLGLEERITQSNDTPPWPPPLKEDSHKRCEEEMRAGLYWNDTETGLLAARGCPPGYDGTVYRPCLPSGGWGPPDFSECRLQHLGHLRRLIGFHAGRKLSGGLKPLCEELRRHLTSSAMFSPLDRLDAMELLVAVLRAEGLRLDLDRAQDLAFIQNIIHAIDEILSKKTALFPYDSKKNMQMRSKVIDILKEMSGFAEKILKSLLLTKKTEIIFKSSENIVLAAFRRQSVQIGSDFGDELNVTAWLGVKLKNPGHMTAVWPDLALAEVRELGGMLDLPDLSVASEVAVLTSLPRLQYPAHSLAFRPDPSKISSDSILECGLLWNSSLWWNERECLLTRTSDQEVVCQCAHPGTIVVLARRISSREHPSSTAPILPVTYLGCAVSALLVLITLFAHIAYFRKGPPEGSLILLNIFIPMVTSQLVFMVGITATSHQQVCYSVALTLHYLYLVTGCWLVCYGVHLYRRLRPPLAVARLRDYCYFSWCLPVILVLLAFLANPRGYETDKYCWLSIHRGMLLSFIVPMTSLILVNTVLMVLVLKSFFELRPVTHKVEIKKTRVFLRAGVSLLPYFAVNWFLGVLALEDATTPIFQYTFTFSNTLQGTLVFIFFLIQDSEINASLRRKFFGRRRKKSLLKLRRTLTPSDQPCFPAGDSRPLLVSDEPCCSKIRL